MGHRGHVHESSSGFSLQELGTNLLHSLHSSRAAGVDSRAAALSAAGVDSRELLEAGVGSETAVPPVVAVPLPLRLAACSTATDSASIALGEGGCDTAGGGSGG